MPPLNRLSPYVIAAAIVFMITFYHVYNVRQKNSDLERNAHICQEALTVSKEKNKVLVKDALEKIEKKDTMVKKLEKENLMKHTKLGETQTKLADLKSKLETKNNEISKLHQLAADHKSEISSLTSSVSKSKSVLKKLSEKADHLMLEYKKLQKQNVELQKQNDQLQNNIREKETEKETLKEELSTLTKDKEVLGMKVNDLQRKNEIIEETIKQKIKESYAARRVMTQKQPVEITEDEHPKLQDTVHATTQVDTKEPSNLVNHSNPDQLDKSITENPEKKLNNILPNMVENSNDANQNESKEIVGNNNSQHIHRIMVNNTDNLRQPEKSPDAFVAKNATVAEQNSFVNDKEKFSETREPSDDLHAATSQSESQLGLQQEIITSENESKGQDINEYRNFPDHQRERRGTNFEVEGGNSEKNSLDEGNEEEQHTITESTTMATFPRIIDDTLNRYYNN